MLDWTAGKTSTALTGYVQNCRATFYCEAFAYWAPRVPPEILDLDAKPKPSGERQARGLVLFGMSPRQELKPAVDEAGRTLQAALNLGASPTVQQHQRDDVLAAWETKTVELLNRKVAQLLSDSLVAIQTMVGRDMILPEYRSTDI